MTSDSSTSAYTAACVDCNTLSGCATSELTAQCTDQCVVIACSDPDHGEASCGGGGQHAQCDPICDEIYNCNDCYGFDAFLQCCDEYQQKIGGSRQVPLDTPPFVWTPALDDFWCACGQSDPPKPPVNPERPADTSSDVLSSPPPVNDIQPPLFKVLPAAIDLSQPTFQVESYSPQNFPKTQYMHSCMWGNCNSSFSSLSELRDHVVLVHLESSPSQPATNSSPNYNITTQDNSQWSLDTPCPWNNCDNSYQPQSIFASPQSLYKHLMSDHLGAWSPVDNSSHFSTPTEPAKQDTFESVISHDGSSSSKNTPKVLGNSESSQDCNAPTHRCCWKDCSFYFSTCDELTSHIASDHVGSGKAHYECFWEGCPRNGDQGFQSKQKICRHVQSHTGHRPFQCSICDQRFSEAATLQQHIRRHTQEKPYVCDYPGCNKSFAITGALTIHKRTHNGDKPFRCSFCNRGFAESSNLSKHLRTHTGARPYTCEEPGCSKSFARPDQLTRHRGIHLKQLGGTGKLPGKVSAQREPATL
ncbi:hypothetical protein BYT27DRAFT_6816240 [Phlegmacium glaucopus]|nr:hypothetical protein BYT27DRAFT_6816240 [Phlegmacium glaucopus]